MTDIEEIYDDQNIIDHSSNYYSIDDFDEIFNTKLNQNSVNNCNTNLYFSLLHINARSLNRNFDEIKLFHKSMKQFPFSVIGITETWLNSKSPDMFHLHDYELYTC